MRPVVHCLLAHDLAFMPHGENLVLVLRDGIPVRALMKDVGEEVAVMGERPVPPDVERIRVKVTDEVKALALLTDVFDGFLRHLAAILDTDGVLGQDAFWAEGGRCVADHEVEHPALATAAASYDLSGRSSRTAASTGCSCATPCRWSTSPARPSRSFTPERWVNPIAAYR